MCLSRSTLTDSIYVSPRLFNVLLLRKYVSNSGTGNSGIPTWLVKVRKISEGMALYLLLTEASELDNKCLDYAYRLI